MTSDDKSSVVAHLIEYQGKRPQVARDVYLAPTATLIGDVRVGEEASIWFGAVLRGDAARILVGPRTSVQDNVVIHVSEGMDCVLAEEVTVGHGAILEGCRVERKALIGMNAVILAGAVVGERSVVAAGSVVGERAVIPPGSLVAGSPAQKKKDVSGSLLNLVEASADEYVRLSKNYLPQEETVPQGIQDPRHHLALACRVLAMEGHSDMNLGHVSVRIPGEPKAYMKPAGLGLDETRAEDIVVVDFAGRRLEGQRPVHKEVFIHTEVYRRREDVAAVVHTHPLFATAFGAAKQTLRPVSHEGVLFADGIPLYERTSDLIMTEGQGKEVAEALADRNAVLMKNHGVVVVGASLEEACLNAIFLEKAVKTQLLASLLGEFDWSPQQEWASKRRNIYNENALRSYWEYFLRKLARNHL